MLYLLSVLAVILSAAKKSRCCPHHLNRSNHSADDFAIAEDVEAPIVSLTTSMCLVSFEIFVVRPSILHFYISCNLCGDDTVPSHPAGRSSLWDESMSQPMLQSPRFDTLKLMQITVTIPDELAIQAQARGLVLDSYLPELLAEDLASGAAKQRPLVMETTGDSPDEASARRHAAVEAMLGFAEKHGFTTGGQNLKNMAHEGHKY